VLEIWDRDGNQAVKGSINSMLSLPRKVFINSRWLDSSREGRSSTAGRESAPNGAHQQKVAGQQPRRALVNSRWLDSSPEGRLSTAGGWTAAPKGAYQQQVVGQQPRKGAHQTEPPGLETSNKSNQTE